MHRTLSLLVLLPAVADAAALRDHDNSPLTSTFGLPDATESGSVLDGGRTAWSAGLQLTSHSVAERAGPEIFIADGETTRLTLEWRRGIADRWEIGLELPYLTHQPGGLDSVIDDWHRVFGFPDGARDDRPRDRLEFAYENDGVTRLDIARPSHGPGDVRMTGGYRLLATARHRLALRLGVKLPTGDEDQLHGSGAADVSLGLAGEREGIGGNPDWTAFYRLHGVFLGKGRWLAARQQSFVAVAAAGATWRARRWLDLTLQASLRGPLYDSN
ncbi:MAG: DUF3187 family protein, partial [Woeseiaceae bacterium]|nr:DUF3187 family protein [Woeseiaceae bacterium]